MELFGALINGNTKEAIKAINKKGFDIERGVGWGSTPLVLACDVGNVEVVKLLLEKGADASEVDSSNGRSTVLSRTRNNYKFSLSTTEKANYLEIIKILSDRKKKMEISKKDFLEKAEVFFNKDECLHIYRALKTAEKRKRAADHNFKEIAVVSSETLIICFDRSFADKYESEINRFKLNLMRKHVDILAETKKGDFVVAADSLDGL